MSKAIQAIRTKAKNYFAIPGAEDVENRAPKYKQSSNEFSNSI